SFLIAFAIVAAVSPATVQAAPAAPVNLWFNGWKATNFSSYSFDFKLKQYVDGVEIIKTYGDNVYEALRYEPDDGMSAGTWTFTSKKQPTNRVMMVYARAFRYNSNWNRVYSAWSKPCGIIPWAKKGSVKITVPNSRKAAVKVSWSKIAYSSGYNVMIATNPKGKWYFAKSGVTSTSATISSCNGSKLKTYKNYYVRVITRKKYSGKVYSAPAPSTGYYSNRFYLYTY
ncbi:MAG: hypothetical protein Q4D81_07925, partial [Eubacteriales bacterium]|nr:hypothetical protein [Eubacteriales bacterium]